MLDAERNLRIGQRTGAAASPGVQIHTALTLPLDGYRGQMIYRADTGGVQVFDGTAWQNVVSGNGSVQTFVSTSAPAADHLGDLWLNPTNSTLSVWDGTSWKQVVDPAAQQALTDAGLAMERANTANSALATLASEVDGKTVTYYQASAPAEASANDLWFNTFSNKLYRHNGATTGDPWQLIQDGDLTAATAQLGDLGAKVDQKVTTYYTSWALRPFPLLAENIGDLLYVSDQGNKIYMWRTGGSGMDWYPLPIGAGAIGDGAVGGSNLTADAINGKTITGATLQTTVASNQGIKLNATTNKLEAFAPDGTPVFVLDGGTGTTQAVGKFSTGLAVPYISLQDYEDGFGAKYGLISFELGTYNAEIFANLDASDPTRQRLWLDSGSVGGGAASSISMESYVTGGIQDGAITLYTPGTLNLYANHIYSNTSAEFLGQVDIGSLTIGSAGRKVNTMRWGRTSFTVDSNGEYNSFAHGLGVTPGLVLATVHNSGDNNLTWTIINKSPTSFGIAMKNNGTPISGSRTIEWIAIA